MMKFAFTSYLPINQGLIIFSDINTVVAKI